MLHKFIRPILMMLLLSFAATSTGWSQNLQKKEREHDEHDSDDNYDRVKFDRYLDVEIWSDRTDGEYYSGDRVTLFYRVNRDAFVVIYSIDSRGRVNMLFPSSPKRDNFVAGGATHRLPGGNDNYDLEISGPEGVENIQIIASRERFTIPDWYPNSGLVAETDDVHDYMDWLNTRYFVKYEGQRFAYDRTALYINEWEDYYFRPVYNPYYPSWTVSSNAYFDYGYGSSIYIDGIYWGVSPLYIPRIYVGWHTFTVYDRYGYGWEHDYHVSRYNTVVFDHTIINTTPNMRSKYKKVRTAGYRVPSKSGYPNYAKKVKSIKASGYWTTKTMTKSGSRATASKKTKYLSSGKKKFVKGSGSAVGSGKIRAGKGDYGSYRKGSRDSKSSAGKRKSDYRGYNKKSTSGSSGYKKGRSSYKKRESKSGSRERIMKSGKSSGKYRPSGRVSSKKGSSKGGKVKSSSRKSSGSKQGSVQKRSGGSKKSGGSSPRYKGSSSKSSGSRGGRSGGKRSSSGGSGKKGSKR